MNDEEMRNRLRPSFTPRPTGYDQPLRPRPITPQPIIKQPISTVPIDPTPVADPVTPVLPSPIIADEPTIASLPPAKSSKKLIIFGALLLGLGGVGTTGYFMTSRKHSAPANNQNSVLGQTTGPEITIPLYYPNNLPAGYTYNNDSKALKSNVYYYSVTGPNKQLFYVTQQPLPISFDFVAFNKKFLKPDSFSTDAGTATVGAVGASVIGSLRTTKNTWIIINSSASSTIAGMETVIRSLKLAQ